MIAAKQPLSNSSASLSDFGEENELVGEEKVVVDGGVNVLLDRIFLPENGAVMLKFVGYSVAIFTIPLVVLKVASNTLMNAGFMPDTAVTMASFAAVASVCGICFMYVYGAIWEEMIADSSVRSGDGGKPPRRQSDEFIGEKQQTEAVTGTQSAQQQQSNWPSAAPTHRASTVVRRILSTSSKTPESSAHSNLNTNSLKSTTHSFLTQLNCDANSPQHPDDNNTPCQNVNSKLQIANPQQTNYNYKDTSTVINNNDTSTVVDNNDTSTVINNNDTSTVVNNNDTSTVINNNDTSTSNNNDTSTVNNNDTSTSNNNDASTSNNNDTSTSNNNDTSTSNNNDTSTVINNNDTSTVINNNDDDETTAKRVQQSVDSSVDASSVQQAEDDESPCNELPQSTNSRNFVELGNFVGSRVANSSGIDKSSTSSEEGIYAAEWIILKKKK